MIKTRRCAPLWISYFTDAHSISISFCLVSGKDVMATCSTWLCNLLLSSVLKFLLAVLRNSFRPNVETEPEREESIQIPKMSTRGVSIGPRINQIHAHSLIHKFHSPLLLSCLLSMHSIVHSYVEKTMKQEITKDSTTSKEKSVRIDKSAMKVVRMLTIIMDDKNDEGR